MSTKIDNLNGPGLESHLKSSLGSEETQVSFGSLKAMSSFGDLGRFFETA
jgi:hypothetical protein